MLKTFFLALILGFSFFTSAKVVEGITVPDSIELKGKKLLLNGVGLRRATFLNVKVYVGALYLNQKFREEKAILDSPYPKYITMTFLRDADGESLREEWKKAFSDAVPNKLREKHAETINDFYNLMGDIKKKQRILLTFLKNGVEVSFNGKKSKLLGNEEFSRALLSVWFINPQDKKLKKELLGID